MCTVLVSCGRETPQTPAQQSRLQVYVHWGDMGIADRRVEVRELAVNKMTDAAGIAEFLIPPGTYTVRLFGINEAGPPPLYIDRTVTTTTGETTRVDVVDCLPCISPREG